jgi:hypothetical protein|tara:strand:+ start:71 stop:460 length:390 start_codon:yes stop_codon:yes gene_type:complete
MKDIVSLIGVAEKYFRLFSAKDLDALDSLFDDNATLRDWETQAKGKPDVLAAMKNIFDSVESIKVSPVNMVLATDETSPLTVIAELDIVVNKELRSTEFDGTDNERLAVVDIIDFTDEGKILGIRAFKG